jgi:hypothetical protein
MAQQKIMRIHTARAGNPQSSGHGADDAFDGVVIAAVPTWLKSDQLIIAKLTLPQARQLALDILTACAQVEKRPPRTKARQPW